MPILFIVVRIFCALLRVMLQALLLVWASAAPVVWVVRDGLGPDMVESGWMLSICKFLALWGIPALVLAVPLTGVLFVERRLARSAGKQSQAVSSVSVSLSPTIGSQDVGEDL